MIINNTHIQGIFKYDPELEFERGDFVIYDDVLYICSAQNPTSSEYTVKNKIPAEDTDNFRIYLGDKSSSIEEYDKYVSGEDISGKDKYITAQVLSAIMGRYLFGVNDRGVITESISNSSLFSSKLSEVLSGNGGEELGILEKILINPDLNFAFIRVSADVEDLKVYFGDPKTEDEVILLRQYTISSGDGSNYRVQELLNPIKGMVAYRVTSGGDYTNVSDWRSSFYDGNVKENLDYIYRYYQRLNTQLRREKQELESSFQFSDISILRGSSVDIQCLQAGEMGYIKLPEGSFSVDSPEVIYSPELGIRDKGIITINFLKNNGNSIYSTSSVTIDIRDSLLNVNPINRYSVGNNFAILNVRRLDDNTLNLSVISQDSLEVIIYNIYYKKYYE